MSDNSTKPTSGAIVLKGSEVHMLMQVIESLDKLTGEQALPFKLKYHLGRIANAWERDNAFIEKERNKIIQRYGTLNEVTQMVEVQRNTPQYAKFQSDYNLVLNDTYSTTSSFNVLNAETLDSLPVYWISYLFGLKPVSDPSYFDVTSPEFGDFTFQELATIRQAVLELFSENMADLKWEAKSLLSVYEQIVEIQKKVDDSVIALYKELGKPTEEDSEVIDVPEENRAQVEEFVKKVQQEDKYALNFNRIDIMKFETLNIPIRTISALLPIAAE